MAITLNDNIRINAGKPSEAKYLSSANIPYASTGATNIAIGISERHIGLTVNILGVEYWYKNGVADSDLILKTVSGATSGGVTGATNIGYYYGLSGVQVLPINHQTDNNYDGDYYSLYNNYYRGTDGRVHIGTPADGISKRGYVKTTLPIKSWIWNEYTGDGLLGWILMNGNISEKIGQFDNGYTYYNGSSTFPYVQTSWSGTPPPNGSLVIIDAIRGSLNTGTTISIGGGVFSQEVDSVLEFKTIQTKTPQTIAISTDEAFVYVSGKTQIGQNIGIGAGIYAGNTGTTLQFRSICGAGSTCVSQIGNEIIISSSGGTGGGDTYNLSSPAAICVGGICCGTVLSGKTSFQLFEELLVPELCGTLSDRSATISTNAASPYEIGSCQSFNICASFNRGSINPSYWTTGAYSASPTERVGLPNTYTFTGAQIAGSYGCTSLSVVKPVAAYCICASQSWDVQIAYDCWYQPKSSKNVAFGTQCLASTATSVPVMVSGIYPYYYGKTTCGVRPPVTQSLITGGTKVAASSTSTVTVTFGSSSSEYTWFAIPSTSPSRVKWWISDLDCGTVNTGPTDKYPDQCLITINSGQGYWTGVQYKVYMSKTYGAITAPMQFRIS
jgi:hypothetical protein